MKVTQKKKFMVGLFMATGIIIILLIFFWLGVTSFFREGKKYVSYFDQSVQGLIVDSPVKFRGVTIGRVSSIGVAPDAKLVQVIMNIDSPIKLTPNMYAQLSVVGITGAMFVEIDLAPEGQEVKLPTLSFKPPYPVIPSKPSEISQLFRGVDVILSKIASLDFGTLSTQLEDTLHNFNQTLETIRQAVNQLEVEKSMDSFQSAMALLKQDLEKARGLLARVDGLVDQSEPRIQTALNDFQAAMAKLNAFTEKASKLAGDSDEYLAELNEQLINVGRNLEQATNNLNRALEEFADHPSQMIFSEPPPPRLGK